jgi:hypothetical protein
MANRISIPPERIMLGTRIPMSLKEAIVSIAQKRGRTIQDEFTEALETNLSNIKETQKGNPVK